MAVGIAPLWGVIGATGKTSFSVLGNATLGRYLHTSTIKATMDIITQYGVKNGEIDYNQSAINGFVPGYQWGLGLNFANNNLNSILKNDFKNDLSSNLLKIRSFYVERKFIQIWA